ncbi:hypothetical protein BAUCODRAFT_151005 [Baudoinia panamericana UAMH 10762]|uniref:F-box domain-containing protein n=1 Tax=Baudoinia panamericana (strain UAMH 10762) TaxID=717646 RepID=M2MMG4_BAUPA|nr:uncharacterized protein BAUCODRAFT_151005 [Baudoinia panamericana UAMH 10762]EMC92573.1 hypothetical protein BAUCODRAFT_151005 [Baudoinia panamericana UAMH 10762]
MSTSVAMEKALDVNELLELMLASLDVRTFVFAAALVCHRWHAMTKRIITSNSVMRTQEALPTTDRNRYVEYEPYRGLSESQLDPSLVLPDPWFYKRSFFTTGAGILEMLQRQEQGCNLRRDTLLSQPPVAEDLWHAKFGRSERAFTSRHGPANEGDVKGIFTNGRTIATAREATRVLEKVMLEHWGKAVDCDGTTLHVPGKKIGRAELNERLRTAGRGAASGSTDRAA